MGGENRASAWDKVDGGGRGGCQNVIPIACIPPNYRGQELRPGSRTSTSPLSSCSGRHTCLDRASTMGRHSRFSFPRTIARLSAESPTGMRCRPRGLVPFCTQSRNDRGSPRAAKMIACNLISPHMPRRCGEQQLMDLRQSRIIQSLQLLIMYMRTPYARNSIQTLHNDVFRMP